jgi:ATP-dependent helicase HepA
MPQSPDKAFRPGQRWFSSAEPELGLGTVLRLAGRQVQLVFTGSGTLRNYAIGSGPLLRAAFRPGDRVRVDGVGRVVERLEEREGLIHYWCGRECFAEGQLDAEQPVSQADARLLAGRVDRNDRFELRREMLERRAATRAHPAWGVLGARIDLIGHQLRVAEVAAARRLPRLLLADEVGLGKTIEACLITAQLIASGRAGRVLVLLPESLVNQWFVELLRRFNLPFSIYDEERCEALEMAARENGGSHGNPFEDEQLVLASVDWLASHPKRAAQALDGEWDLLLVDEAHHLSWSPAEASPAYALVDALAARTPALLLLTATPEQLGLGGHFARLRLLDPARYTDLDAFVAEQQRYVALSELAGRLLASEQLTAGDMESLAPLFPDESDALAQRLAAIAAGDGEARDRLLADLVDRHGTGRVMIRNRRVAVGGFPKRIAHLDVLPEPEDVSSFGRLRAEFEHDVGEHADEPEHDYKHDPRTDWLLAKLDALAPAKVLLLCRTRAKVQALEEALRLRSGLPVARFHEDMNLLQRDRNAAFFADPEGARLLIASEIGAEGRNFQFAQHLLFWDLPFHPDALEQRIGRLDRIGQRGEVHLHSVAVEGSPQQVLQRWLHEGLGAFEHVVADGRELLRRFAGELLQIVGMDPEERELALADLVARTRAVHAELAETISRGRDRLLELGSRRGLGPAAQAHAALLPALMASDAEALQDDYPLRLLEAFGIHGEPIGRHTWLLDPEYLTVEGFEEFKGGPRSATFDRATALARDDLLYLRADHPMLLSAQEMLASGETGNAAFLLDDSLPPRTAILECVFVLELVAPPRLDADRFLPPLPATIAVDSRLQKREGFVPNERAVHRAADRQHDLSGMRKVLGALVPPMLERARDEGEARCAQLAAEAAANADAALGAEIQRLEALARINPAVRPAEIERLREERAQLLALLPQARPRLDALRLVVSPDFLSLR